MMAQASGDVGSVDDIATVEQHDIYNRMMRQFEIRLERIERKEISRIDVRIDQLQEHITMLQSMLSDTGPSAAAAAPSPDALEHEQRASETAGPSSQLTLAALARASS